MPQVSSKAKSRQSILYQLIYVTVTLFSLTSTETVLASDKCPKNIVDTCVSIKSNACNALSLNCSQEGLKAIKNNDTELAILYLNRACRLGVKETCVVSGEIQITQKNINGAKIYFLRACEIGSEVGCAKLLTVDEQIAAQQKREQEKTKLDSESNLVTKFYIQRNSSNN